MHRRAEQRAWTSELPSLVRPNCKYAQFAHATPSDVVCICQETKETNKSIVMAIDVETGAKRVVACDIPGS